MRDYNKNKRRHITFEVNSDGCQVCTSHMKDKDGYIQVQRNGKKEQLHRYLYEQEYGKQEGKVIRHLCNNPSCINLNHLKAGTHKENSNDAKNAGNILKGSKCHLSKLNEEKVKEIKLKLDSFSDKEISLLYDVIPATIWFIRNGVTWKHVNNKEDLKWQTIG